MLQSARDHRIPGDFSSSCPSNAHSPRNHCNRSWKVKRRLKLVRRHSSQALSNVQAPRSHRSRGWKVKRRLKLAYRHDGIHGDYASSEARGEKEISTPPLMQFMEYVPPLLLALVVMKYQGKPQIIFWENPVPLWFFFTATCVYWLIVGAMKRMTTLSRKWFEILSHAALASAILSAISMVSIFLPYPVSLLVLSSFVVALVLLYAYRLFLRGIECVINKIHGILVWTRGSNLTEEASLPV